jgi:flagellar FliL protein
MAEEEMEGDVTKSSSLLKYILIGLATLLLLLVTVVATMFFLGAGPFESKAAEAEKLVEKIELDFEEARKKAEELAKGPQKQVLDSPELTRFENTYMEIERPMVANIVNSRKVMQIKIAIMTHYDDRVVANMEKHAPAIRSEVLDVIRKIDEQQLNSDNFRRDLATDIKISMNSVLERYEDFGGVEEVLFTEFVVQ